MNIDIVEEKIINKNLYKELELLINSKDYYEESLLSYDNYTITYSKVQLIRSYFIDYLSLGTSQKLKYFLIIMNTIVEDKTINSIYNILFLVNSYFFPFFSNNTFTFNLYHGTLHIIKYFVNQFKFIKCSKQERYNLKITLINFLKRQYDLNLITIKQFQFYIKFICKNENIFFKMQNMFILFNK